MGFWPDGRRSVLTGAGRVLSDAKHGKGVATMSDDILALGGMHRDGDGKVHNGPKFPDLTVQLTGTDGNAFAILATMDRALSRHGVSQADRIRFRNEATASDYDQLLATCKRWAKVR
jgi:hypothetical protein